MSEQPETPQEPMDSVQSAEPTVPEFAAPLPAEAIRPEKLPRFPAPHAQKFNLALSILAGVAAAAIVIAILVASGHTSHQKTSGRAWSAWQPSVGGGSGAQEIADYLAPFYRMNIAQQLDVITPVALTSSTSAGTTTGKGLTIAVNSTGASSSSSSLSLLNGQTAAYNICGLGAKNCQLAGTASANRLLLLRREALEIALYTFKYVGGTQNVLVVLPPGHTAAAAVKPPLKANVTPVTVAVLFVRAELAPILAVPLNESLQPDPPDVAQLPAWSKSDEAGLVDQVTARGLFSEQVESQQEGGNLLVLTPLTPQ
jgi:hypothetical protein